MARSKVSARPANRRYTPRKDSPEMIAHLAKLYLERGLPLRPEHKEYFDSVGVAYPKDAPPALPTRQPPAPSAATPSPLEPAEPQWPAKVTREARAIAEQLGFPPDSGAVYHIANNLSTSAEQVAWLKATKDGVKVFGKPEALPSAAAAAQSPAATEPAQVFVWDMAPAHALAEAAIARAMRKPEQATKPAPAQEILPPGTATQPLADPAMAAALVTVGASQSEIEAAIMRVLLSRFGEIERQRALDAIFASTKDKKRRPFDQLVSRLKRENRNTLAQAAPKPWLRDLYVKGDAPDPHPTLANACIVFRAADAWDGVLWHNEFTGMIHVRRCPPYEEGTAGQPCDRSWTDADEQATAEWMQTFGGIPEMDGWRLFSAINRIASENRFHPVRDYLDSLKFDPAELAPIHFEDWLTYYCGVTDTPYSRAIGSRFIISAVARIYQPGCKADCSLILEGPQGLKKSTVFKTLASEPWFTDASEDIGSKDAALQRRGKWFWEHAELDNLNRGEVGRIKADMSRSTDRFRPPYGRNMIEEPRQSVHCGTVNDRQYLRDPTGARRFWPALCGPSIDIDALEADRDKLWAVAAMRYRQRARWYLDDPKLIAMAKAEQDARYVEDAWDAIITEWLEKPQNDGQPRQTVTVAVIFVGALNIDDRAKWTKDQQARITRCLTRLCWEYKQVRIGDRKDNKRAWRWIRPGWSQPVTSLVTDADLENEE